MTKPTEAQVEQVVKAMERLTRLAAQVGVPVYVYFSRPDTGQYASMAVHRQEDQDGNEGELICAETSLKIEVLKRIVDGDAVPIPIGLALKLLPVLKAAAALGVDAIKIEEVRDVIPADLLRALFSGQGGGQDGGKGPEGDFN